ncbi:MAG: hypothetical protein H6837_10045 [Planctomycetes bacterium]|nr:hypothetical protein [Planctomycetota bacterium]
MKVLGLTCNNCGAPLEVPEKTRYLTCAFCESRLEVHRSGAAHFTEVLEAVGEIRADLATIKRQNDLERLDREWQLEREKWLTIDQHGRGSVPTVASGVMAIVVGFVGGVVFFAMGSRVSCALGGLGVLFAVVSSIIGFGMIARANRFEQRRAEYRRRRQGLVRALR